MTLDEFMVHLKSQSWELDYVINIVAAKEYISTRTTNNFINSFSWQASLNKPAHFWKSLCNTSYDVESPLLIDDIIQRVTNVYSQTHPEVFI